MFRAKEDFELECFVSEIVDIFFYTNNQLDLNTLKGKYKCLTLKFKKGSKFDFLSGGHLADGSVLVFTTQREGDISPNQFLIIIPLKNKLNNYFEEIIEH